MSCSRRGDYALKQRAGHNLNAATGLNLSADDLTELYHAAAAAVRDSGPTDKPSPTEVIEFLAAQAHAITNDASIPDKQKGTWTTNLKQRAEMVAQGRMTPTAVYWALWKQLPVHMLTVANTRRCPTCGQYVSPKRGHTCPPQPPTPPSIPPQALAPTSLSAPTPVPAPVITETARAPQPEPQPTPVTGSVDGEHLHEDPLPVIELPVAPIITPPAIPDTSLAVQPPQIRIQPDIGQRRRRAAAIAAISASALVLPPPLSIPLIVLLSRQLRRQRLAPPPLPQPVIVAPVRRARPSLRARLLGTDDTVLSGHTRGRVSGLLSWLLSAQLHTSPRAVYVHHLPSPPPSATSAGH